MAFVYWLRLPEHTDPKKQGYVGVTSRTVEFRFKRHVFEAERGDARCVHLARALNKHGKDRIIRQTLCEADFDYCLDVERKLRPAPGLGWNVGAGGRAPALGRKVSEETRTKLSEAWKTRIVSEETRAKISQAAKGNQRAKGKTPSPEVREKLRAANLGKPLSTETKAKLSAAHKGKKHSAEHVEKRAACHRGAVRSEEARRRMREGRARAKANRAALASATDFKE